MAAADQTDDDEQQRLVDALADRWIRQGLIRLPEESD